MSVLGAARASPIRAASAGATRTPGSATRRCSPSPTAWAAPAAGRSPPASPRRARRVRRRQRRVARRRTHPGGEPPGLRARARGLGRLGDGHDDHRRPLRGRHRLDRPRRRLPRLPDPRPQGRPADRGSLARRRARPHRQALAGGGRDAPAALGDHARARNRPRRRRRRVLGRGEAGRPVPHLLGRADRDGRRRDDPRRRRAAARRPRRRREGARRRREPQRRRGQHHRRLLRGRRRGRRSRARRSRCPRSAGAEPAEEEADEDTLTEARPRARGRHDGRPARAGPRAGGRDRARGAQPKERLSVQAARVVVGSPSSPASPSSCTGCSARASDVLAQLPQPRARQPLRRRDHDRPRLRERLHRAPGRHLDRLALVRPLLLRALPRGTRGRPADGAAGRSVPAPDGRAADGVRRDRDLPARSRQRVPAGTLDRRRRRGLLRDADPAAARLPATRELQVPLRAGRDRPAHPARAARDRPDGERRAALGGGGRHPLPAGRAREDHADRLPRGLPPREARGARPGPAEGLRAAAPHLGRGDARDRR